MPYVTFAERYGRKVGEQEGRVQTLREGILDILDARFGEVPAEIHETVSALEGEVRLKALHRHAALAGSLEEFRVAI